MNKPEHCEGYCINAPDGFRTYNMICPSCQAYDAGRRAERAATVRWLEIKESPDLGDIQEGRHVTPNGAPERGRSGN